MPIPQHLIDSLSGRFDPYGFGGNRAVGVPTLSALERMQSLGLSPSDSYTTVPRTMRSEYSHGEETLLRDLSEGPITRIIPEDAQRLRARLNAIRDYLQRNPHVR